MQFPTGMGFFRPDLNFEGTSEREIEVGLPTGMVNYRVCGLDNIKPHQTLFSLPFLSLCLRFDAS